MAFIANMCLASQRLKKCPLSQDMCFAHTFCLICKLRPTLAMRSHDSLREDSHYSIPNSM